MSKKLGWDIQNTGNTTLDLNLQRLRDQRIFVKKTLDGRYNPAHIDFACTRCEFKTKIATQTVLHPISNFRGNVERSRECPYCKVKMVAMGRLVVL